MDTKKIRIQKYMFDLGMDITTNRNPYISYGL